MLHHVGLNMTMYLKLFGRESIPTCVKNISERHGQTNRQRERERERERERDDLLWHNRALHSISRLNVAL